MTALSVRAQAPCRAQFERMRGGISVSGSTRSNRRVPARRRSSTACVPRAVSIYDAVRKSSYDDRDGSDGFGAADSALNAPPASGSKTSTSAQTPPRKSKPGPAIVPPAVISSKAAMLAAAEDLASADCDIDDDECAKRAINDDASADEQDGIVKWSIKALDKNLDDLERTKPRQAEVAWKVASEAEKVVRSPGFQKGAKVTGDVGMGVIKAAAPVVGKVAGEAGKFAAKTAFRAVVGGVVKGIDGQVSKVKNGGAGSSGKDKEAGSKKGGGSKGGLGGLFNKK
jgi:hypothetical protein